MPQFRYRARNKQGHSISGDRFSPTLDSLSAQLIKDGIYPIEITQIDSSQTLWQKISTYFQDNNLHREELSIFSRQMQLLHKTGVPMVIALKQLAEYTRSKRLKFALNGIIEYVERGDSLATAMNQYPTVFSPLVINLVKIGESTGNLSDAFGHIHDYLAFEASNIKQVKSAFRYPSFIILSILFSIVSLNLFVIPSFSNFYSRLDMTLPWQTRILMGSSYLFVHYGIYFLIASILGFAYFLRYIHTPEGRYKWNKFQLSIPIGGRLLNRIILIRFSQSLSIMLNAGVPITQSLELAKQIIINAYVQNQIVSMQDAIERGFAFSQALGKVELFSPLETQILSVGETNGELAQALSYVSNFHSHEIEFDLKRMNDLIGPILISIVSGIILVIALGIYLPIWNMVKLAH